MPGTMPELYTPMRRKASWPAERYGSSIRFGNNQDAAMGGILGGGSIAKQQKAVGSLQFQTSQQGGIIPLVYGTTRLSGNLLDYDDFRATASSKTGGKGKGGGGGKGGGENNTFSASF